MSETPTQVKPRWLQTSKVHPILGRCVSPCEGAWNLDPFLSDSGLRSRLLRELENVAAMQPYLLLPGGGRIVHPQAPWEHSQLSRYQTLLYQSEPVVGLWLNKGMTIVAPLVGRPFVFARAGGAWLALHYTDDCVRLIRRHVPAVAPSDITVYALFGKHRKAPGPDYCTELESACKNNGISFSCELRLEHEGEFGYAEHPTNTKLNLGLFSLR